MLSPIPKNRSDRGDPDDDGHDSQHEEQRGGAGVAKILCAGVSPDAADHQQGQSDRGSDTKHRDEESDGQSQGAGDLQRPNHALQLRPDA
jgi:hypothetical protein